LLQWLDTVLKLKAGNEYVESEQNDVPDQE